MKAYGVNELRRMFLEFFESKGHLAMKSFSLVPHNDNSLLLINSGMAPMKPYFKGDKEPPRHRISAMTGKLHHVLAGVAVWSAVHQQHSVVKLLVSVENSSVCRAVALHFPDFLTGDRTEYLRGDICGVFPGYPYN